MPPDALALPVGGLAAELWLSATGWRARWPTNRPAGRAAKPRRPWRDPQARPPGTRCGAALRMPATVMSAHPFASPYFTQPLICAVARRFVLPLESGSRVRSAGAVGCRA